MEFDLTAEQRSLRDLARSFATRSFDETAVRAELDTEHGFDREVWRALGTDLGVLGLTLPVALGGDSEPGAPGHVELALLAEELGRTLAGVPLLSTVALAGTALSHVGDDPDGPDGLAAELVGGVVDGGAVLALVATDARGRWSPGATDVTVDAGGTAGGGSDVRLTGTASHVLDAAAADTLLVVAQTPDGPRLHVVRADAEGVRTAPQTTLDQTRRLAVVRFDATPATPLAAAGAATLDAVAAARDVGALVLAAGAVGAGARLLETSVEHAKGRLQFGRPIGSFQGVKHRCADMLVAVEQSRSVTYHAAWTLDGATDDEPRTAVDLATVVTAAAFPALAKNTVQVHGGIGFTWEHPTHLYYKRAVGDAALLGGRAAAAERLAASVLDAAS
ncbi:acyl-CoA dehydrogenase family protein [Nocardioides dongxiaopingii]|uniref:acyl-CoA dehydrogenase family protein n=1 Tax=Nocardioides dongxiaopingii TaxID=2576036 RepID=UPI0010C76540|nr:acyl-CoA dehydrogenase family protein [Nocardioides dongxiaopingii]